MHICSDDGGGIGQMGKKGVERQTGEGSKNTRREGKYNECASWKIRGTYQCPSH